MTARLPARSLHLGSDMLLLQSALKVLPTLVGVRRASLMLVEAGSGQLAVVCAHGMDARIRRQARASIGEGIAGTVVETGRPMSSGDAGHPPLARDRKGLGYTTDSFVCEPVTIWGQVCGVLNCSDPTNEAGFTERDIRTVRTVTEHLSKCLESMHARGLLSHRWRSASPARLWNRDELETRLEEELASAKRHSYSLTLVTLTVTSAPRSATRKRADEVEATLQRLAAIVRTSTRKGDILAKFDSTGLAIILPHADKSQAEMVIARVMELMAGKCAERHHSAAVHVRIAAFPEPCEATAQMLAEAQASPAHPGSTRPGRPVRNRVLAKDASPETSLRVEPAPRGSKPRFALLENMPEERVANLVPLELAERYHCVPIAEEDGVLTVATVHGNEDCLTPLQDLLGRSIYIVWSSEQSVARALHRMTQLARRTT